MSDTYNNETKRYLSCLAGKTLWDMTELKDEISRLTAENSRLSDALAKAEKRAEAAVLDIMDIRGSDDRCLKCRHDNNGNCLHHQGWAGCQAHDNFEWNDPTKED